MKWAYGWGWIWESKFTADNISVLLRKYNKTQDNKKIGKNTFWEGKKLPQKMRDKIGKSHNKKVAQIDPNIDKIIKIYNSVKEAKEKIKGSVGKVCSGKRKLAGGFKWKYI